MENGDSSPIRSCSGPALGKTRPSDRGPALATYSTPGFDTHQPFFPWPSAVPSPELTPSRGHRAENPVWISTPLERSQRAPWRRWSAGRPCGVRAHPWRPGRADHISRSLDEASRGAPPPFQAGLRERLRCAGRRPCPRGGSGRRRPVRGCSAA